MASISDAPVSAVHIHIWTTLILVQIYTTRANKVTSKMYRGNDPPQKTLLQLLLAFPHN